MSRGGERDRHRFRLLREELVGAVRQDDNREELRVYLSWIREGAAPIIEMRQFSVWENSRPTPTGHGFRVDAKHISEIQAALKAAEALLGGETIQPIEETKHEAN